mgnify:CR=1 FL=1
MDNGIHYPRKSPQSIVHTPTTNIIGSDCIKTLYFAIKKNLIIWWTSILEFKMLTKYLYLRENKDMHMFRDDTINDLFEFDPMLCWSEF